jgi:hypothetical protein
MAAVYELVISNAVSSDERVVTFQRVISKVKVENEAMFKNMMKRLNDKLTVDEFESIARKIVADQHNWGRIAMILAVATFVDREQTKIVANIIDEMTRAWINANGGLTDAVSFFRETQSVEKKIWKGLAWTIAGLGATAAIVYISK